MFFEDLLDEMLDFGFGYSSSPFDSFFGGIDMLGVFLIIILVAAVAVVYFMRGYTLLNIGRKAGISEEFTWMPFIPGSQAVYRYKIFGESPWKLFCWTDHMFYALVIILSCIILKLPVIFVLILTAIVYLFAGRLAFLLTWFVLMILCFSVPGMPAGWTVFATIVFLYLGVTLAFRFVFYKRLYGAFNINPLFAIHIFIPFGGFVALIIDYLMAYSGNYQMGGRAAAPAGAGMARPPMPQQQMPRQGSGGYGGQMPPQQQPQQKGIITGISGMYRNAIIDIPYGEEIILGRDSAMAHVIIDQDADRVSRRHIGIRYNTQDGSYIVTDYSTNGTFREDGSRLPSNMPVALARGTVVKLGSSQVSFRLG